MFPYFSQKKDPALSRKIFAGTVFVCLLSYLFIVLFGNSILELISKKDLNEGAYLFKYLGLLIIFSPLSALIGTILLSNNHSRFLPNNLIFSTIVYFIIVGILFITEKLNLIYLIMAVILSIIFELLNRIWFLRKYRLHNWLYK